MTATRMNAADRRELILAAGTRAFARSGFAGTSTDAVAREAGVSQPYVVRMFGTKAELFRDVFQRASDSIQATFGAVLDNAAGLDEEEVWERLSYAYSALVSDRDLLLVVMHGYIAGTPELQAQARACMTAVFAQLRDGTGADPQRVREFIAHGMLLNTLLAMDAPTHTEDPDLAELNACTFGDTLDAALGSP